MGHGYRPIISKIRVESPNKYATKKKNYNLLHYIATREGVDLTRVNTLEEMINDNLDLTDAGEEILFKQADSEAYLKYIAHRPRSHGLFGNIDTEEFENASKLLNKASDEKKLIFKGIISLSELDAQALGYTNAAKWELYLKSVIPDIAQTLGLSPNNITWVGAFHAEQKHPHVHYMLWDNRDIVKKAYIHKQQQIECRDICQKAMFTEENEAIIKAITAAEREEYYETQNSSRQNITGYVKELFLNGDFIPGVKDENLPGRMSSENHKELNELYKNVINTMPGKGRISYKFMPPECKAYIDRVSDIFLKQPDIKSEYNKYINAIKDIHRSLGATKEEISKAENNAINELKARTGNIILKGICSIREDILQMNETGQFAGSSENVWFSKHTGVNEDEKMDMPDYIKELSKMTNNSSENYNPVEAEHILKEKLEEAEPEEKNYIYKMLAAIYADNNSVLEDYDKAVECLKTCISNNMLDGDIFVMLGKIYADRYYLKNNMYTAEKYYLESLNYPKNNYIKLRLSRMYADEKSVLFDYDKALDILNGASDFKGSVSLQKGNLYLDQESPFYDIEKALKFYEDAVNKGNAHAAYQLGKIYTNTENELYDLKRGMEYMQKAATEGIIPAQIKLGKIYMDKENMYYNIAKAHSYFLGVLDELDKTEYKDYRKLSKGELTTKAQVCAYLGKLYAENNVLKDYDKAIAYLSTCIEIYENQEEDNVTLNSAYAKIAQIYADKETEYYNPYEAEKYLNQAIHNIIFWSQEIDTDKDQKFTTNILQGIQLKLCNLYIDEQSPLWNLEKAFSAVENERDDKGILALKRGNIYANEKYSGYDMQKAIASFREAIEYSNTTAMVKLAKCYLYGIGVGKDRTEARYWLERAADAGDEYANDYINKMGTEKFNQFTYSILRQVFSSMSQSRQKSVQRLQEAEFKSKSKQAKKEEYIHRN